MDEAERHSSTRGMIVHVHVKLSTVRRCTIAVSIGMRCELTGGRRNGDDACVRSPEIYLPCESILLAPIERLIHSVLMERTDMGREMSRRRVGVLKRSWRFVPWLSKGSTRISCLVVPEVLSLEDSTSLACILLLSRLVATADDAPDSTTAWILDGTVTRRVASICLVQQTHRVPLTASLAAS